MVKAFYALAAIGGFVVFSAIVAAVQSAAWRITSKLDTEGMEW